MKTKTLIIVGGVAAAAFLYARSRGIDLTSSCGWKQLIGQKDTCCAGCAGAAGATAAAAAGGAKAATPITSAAADASVDILPDVAPASAAGFTGLASGLA